MSVGVYVIMCSIYFIGQ